MFGLLVYFLEVKCSRCGREFEPTKCGDHCEACPQCGRLHFEYFHFAKLITVAFIVVFLLAWISIKWFPAIQKAG
jgi:hypothetical protein